MSKSEVAQSQRKDVALYDYGDQAEAGFDNVGGADLVLPFLGVLQALSPQVTEKPGAGGIEGAKAGMLINTVTDELFDGEKGVLFVPAYTEHVFVEWVPRKQGGGFVAVHPVDSELIKQAKKDAAKFGKFSTSYDGEGRPTGNDLVETFYVYGVMADGDDHTPIAIAFTSTKIAVYKRWMTKLNMFQVTTPQGGKQRPPIFAHQVRVTTTTQKNNEGTFHNFALGAAVNGSIKDSLLAPDSALFQEAASVLEMVRSGMARLARDSEEGAKAAGVGGDAGAEEPAPF